MKKILFFTSVLLGSLIFSDCSTKKATITNRTYHRITSWYNSIFNANQLLVGDLKSKKETYSDNYSAILPVDPTIYFNKNEDEIELFLEFIPTESNKNEASVYEKVRNKCFASIQRHSMLIKGIERNTMLDEAYLLIGKSYLYENLPYNAINYFTYINEKFEGSNLNNKANIYKAIAYDKTGDSYRANEIFLELSEIRLKKIDKKLFSNAFSQFLIDNKNYEEAIEALNIAKKYNKKKNTKARYNFIQGQLSEQISNPSSAEEFYQKAYKLSNSSEMKIKSQIALTHLFNGDSLEYLSKMKFLKKMMRKGIYTSKKNEIYYAMGILTKKTAKDSIGYFQKALKEKESDPQVRALTYKEIGDYYYDQLNYSKAGIYYDSAAVRFTDQKMGQDYMEKSVILINIVKKDELIKKNDSLIALIKMPDNQRINYFEEYIKNLKEKEERERIEEENEEENVVFVLDSEDNIPFFVNSSSGKWYFYNNNAKQQGKKDFDKTWPNQFLADNWRDGAISSSSIRSKEELVNKELQIKNPRRFEAEFYLEQIPSSNQLENLKLERDSVELSLGIDYNQKLNNKELATSTLEHLLSFSPEEDIKIKALYNLYVINKDLNPLIADKYKNQLLTEYPNTRYAQFVLSSKKELEEDFKFSYSVYEEAYNKYKEKDYDSARNIINEYIKNSPKDLTLSKFYLLRAFCYAKEGNVEEFYDQLKDINNKYSDYPEGQKAKQIIDFIDEKNKREKQELNTQEIINTQEEESQEIIENEEKTFREQ